MFISKQARFNSIAYLLGIWMCMGTVVVDAQNKTNPKDQSEELGRVSWYRDYHAALQLSAEKNKPVLILFQEVPGCMTCRNYGQHVLSHPLMVEVIENEFIPLAIYNNKGGKDAEILKKYGEPSWNNPVVRIVNAQGDNIVNRVARNYSAWGLYQAMTTALKQSRKKIPAYVDLLGRELSANQNQSTEEAYYRMYCFWSGAKHLGASDAVLSTEAGFMAGHEVVKVTYDTKKINATDLERYAASNRCSAIKADHSYRASAKDDYYYLQHSNYKYLPLTTLQKTKINVALGDRQGSLAQQYLSPQQLKWLKAIPNDNGKLVSFVHQDFKIAWKKKAGN